MKRLTLILVVLAAVAAPAAQASDRQLLIVQDHGAMLDQPDATAAQFASLGADVVKIQLFWGDVAPAGRRKPAGFDASDPASYHWGAYPAAVNAISAAGMRPFVSIGGRAPRWATRGSGPTRHRAPERGGVRALRRRPWGGSSRTCDIWSMWNEPNLYSLAQPQRTHGVPQSPSIYRKLYLAGHAALGASGHGGDTILLGELVPRGGTSPRKIRPLVFLREMVCLNSHYRQYRGRAARARGCGKVGRIPTSGLAYHPYTLARRARASTTARGDAAIGELGRGDEDARRARPARQAAAQAAALDHRVRLPDEPARPHLRRSAEARRRVHGRERVPRLPRSRVASYSQYTLLDDPPRRVDARSSAGRPGSPGCGSANCKPKPGVYGAFRLPFLVRSLGPRRGRVFGGGRTGSGPVASIEAKPGGHTVRSRPCRSTTAATSGRSCACKGPIATCSGSDRGLTRTKRPTVVL